MYLSELLCSTLSTRFSFLVVVVGSCRKESMTTLIERRVQAAVE